MHIRCPICNISLQALTPRKREEHCDVCLDKVGSAEFSGVPLKTLDQAQITPQIDAPPLKRRPASQLDKPTKKLEVNVKNEAEKSNIIEVKLEKPESRQPVAIEENKSVAEPTKELQKTRRMPFYKVLTFGNTKIAVDAFCYGAIPGVKSYFLSHFHSDHYGGLSKNWKHGPIYCSNATAQLLMLKLKVLPEYIKPLEMNTKYTIEGIDVLLMDANHCPGAVLFLFNERVLHTGDFRATKQLVSRVLDITPRLDEVYLDTTYLDPNRKFPAQEHVIRLCADYCEKQQALPIPKSFFTKTPEKRRILAVVGTYTIGKERLAVAIAQKLNQKIWCTLPKQEVLKSLDSAEINALLTDNGYESQVHLSSMHELTIAKLEQKWSHLKNYFTHLIAFIPTGWTWPTKATEFTEKMLEAPRTSSVTSGGQIRICRVPYSEHSSFEDLEMFCNSIECRRLIATVPTKRYDILRNWERR